MKRLISAISCGLLIFAVGCNATPVSTTTDTSEQTETTQHIHDENCTDATCTETDATTAETVVVEETVTETVTDEKTGETKVVTKKVTKQVTVAKANYTAPKQTATTAKQTTATTAKPAQQTQKPATTSKPATTAKPATTKAPTTAKPAHTHSWKRVSEPVYEVRTYVPESSKTYAYKTLADGTRVKAGWTQTGPSATKKVQVGRKSYKVCSCGAKEAL